jgi:hypothetical protein
VAAQRQAVALATMREKSRGHDERKPYTQQVMVIVPVNADGREAQHVDQQARDQRLERLEAVAGWGPEFQHHDGDDHGKHGVAEAFQACGTHLAWWVRLGLLVFHASLPPSLRDSAPLGISEVARTCRAHTNERRP